MGDELFILHAAPLPIWTAAIVVDSQPPYLRPVSRIHCGKSTCQVKSVPRRQLGAPLK
jgi:hypothetical protein